MLKAEDTKAKEEQIMELIRDIAQWYHKWEEKRDGDNFVCIEYKRMFDPERDSISIDGTIT